MCLGVLMPSWYGSSVCFSTKLGTGLCSVHVYTLTNHSAPLFGVSLFFVEYHFAGDIVYKTLVG